MGRKTSKRRGLNISDKRGRPQICTAWLVAFGASQTGDFHWNGVQLLRETQCCAHRLIFGSSRKTTLV